MVQVQVLRRQRRGGNASDEHIRPAATRHPMAECALAPRAARRDQTFDKIDEKLGHGHRVCTTAGNDAESQSLLEASTCRQQLIRILDAKNHDRAREEAEKLVRSMLEKRADSEKRSINDPTEKPVEAGRFPRQHGFGQTGRALFCRASAQTVAS